jgi:LysM repeat protein
MYMVLILLIPSISRSQTEDIKDYKVNSGDTLWNISGKELGDPFLWPKIWQENPKIANPDRIYPGQKIRIPLRYAQKEEQEKQAVSAEPSPVESPKVVEKAEKYSPSLKLRPLIDRSILVGSGYISDSVKGVGTIAGAPSQRIMFGNNDIVYVKIDNPVKVGDRFYILRKGELVRHPVTNKKMGYLVEMLGVVEILRFEDGDTLAKITEMFSDIHSGDLLETYYEISPPLTTGVFRKPDITGYVVASHQGHLGDAKLNIVYIDKGLNDGLDVGDTVKTLNVIDDHKIPSGAIQIISCRETTSTAVVLENYYSEIVVGNLITKLE